MLGILRSFTESFLFKKRGELLLGAEINWTDDALNDRQPIRNQHVI